jgi:hypothetical protein
MRRRLLGYLGITLKFTKFRRRNLKSFGRVDLHRLFGGETFSSEGISVINFIARQKTDG